MWILSLEISVWVEYGAHIMMHSSILYMFGYRFVSFIHDFVYVSECVSACLCVRLVVSVEYTTEKNNILFFCEFVFAFSSLLLCRIRFATRKHTRTRTHTSLYTNKRTKCTCICHKNTQSSPIFNVRNIQHTYPCIHTNVPYFFLLSSFIHTIKCRNRFLFEAKKEFYSQMEFTSFIRFDFHNNTTKWKKVPHSHTHQHCGTTKRIEQKRYLDECAIYKWAANCT